MTIDLDHSPTAAGPRRGRLWIAALAVACVLLGADLANRLTPRDTPPAPAVMHTVTIVVRGGQPYIALTGTVDSNDVHNAATLVLPVGTTVHVWVVGTVKGGEVYCSIAIDGGEPITMNGYGVGAVASCHLPVRDQRT